MHNTENGSSIKNIAKYWDNIYNIAFLEKEIRKLYTIYSIM